MYSRKFNKSIGIVGKKSKQKLEGSVDLPDPEAKVFVDHTFDLLTTLAKKPLGRMLLEEIEATKRAVIIFCDDASGAGSAAQPYPGTAENEIGRFVKIRQIPKIAITALQKNDPSYLPPSMANYGALVHSALERSKMNRDMVAALCGISRDDLDLIELGMKQLPPEAYHRFALILYDYLDAGSGCSVGLRMDFSQAQGDDTELIILGHELVHVWRMVTGRRVFEGGWEEEAMTTGLPPFMNLKFTENKLRVEQGLPLRTKYTALCKTAHYQMVSQLDGGKGIWPEHVGAWEKWQKANPKLAEKKLKITKHSVFSNPIKTLFNR